MYGPNRGDLFLELTGWPLTVKVTYSDEDGRKYEQIFRQEPPARAMRGAYQISYPPKLESMSGNITHRQSH